MLNKKKKIQELIDEIENSKDEEDIESEEE